MVLKGARQSAHRFCALRRGSGGAAHYGAFVDKSTAYPRSIFTKVKLQGREFYGVPLQPPRGSTKTQG